MPVSAVSIWNAILFCLSITFFSAMSASAQQAVKLTPAKPATAPIAQRFEFVSDGPIGPGWTRPNEIARTYFHEQLPAFFSRTLTIDHDLPRDASFSWIFTGPHAGFTVQLSASKVRLFQRYYDSTGLYSGHGNFPEKVVSDSEQQFEGDAHTLAVVVDSHLSVRVLVNGKELLRQSCVFDVTRHQLMLSAPRTEHEVVSGALLATTTDHASISVNPSKHYQEIFGFGGSPSIPAYAHLSAEGKAQYWTLLKRYNLLIDREYPMGTQLKPDMSNLDDLSEATPHYYGDNFPNGEVSDFDYSKHALAMGGSVVYEMWALPKWATQTYHSSGKPTIDAWGRAVQSAAKPEEYARAVVAYCKQAQLRTGSPPAVVGIENEVEQPPEIFDQMVLTLRRELDRAGFTSVKIHMADASFMYMGVERAKRLQHDPAVWKAIDFTATHEYDYQGYFANPDMYDQQMRAMHAASGDKPFLATEICVNDPHYQEPSYRVAFNVGQLYHKNLTTLDAVGIMYCWLLLDVEQPTFGGSRSLLVPDRNRSDVPVASSFELRVLGAFSRHILRGMHRVETATDNPDLLTSAYEGDGKSTLVVMNRSTSPQHLIVNWSGRKWVQIERTSPYLENAISNQVSSDEVIQPGEIVVLSTFSVN